MKDVIQHLNILKSHKSETYSVNDGRVKVTGKPSKYFSLTLLLSRLCEDHHEHKHQEAVSMRGSPVYAKVFKALEDKKHESALSENHF